MSDDFARLAYEASLRALDRQERVLDEIRARTGLLLAAASLTASFLGPPAFEQGNNVLVVVALVAFAFTVGASLYVLVPKENLVFSVSGPGLYEGLYAYRDDLSETYRRLAYDLHRFWESNDEKLVPLFVWFRRAGIALGLEVVLLLVATGANLF